MKKILYLLLTLCLLLGILPSQALAYVGDILPSTGSTVTTETRADGTLVLQNDYIRVTLNKHDGSLTTSPAATADSANSIDRQKPYCEFIITFRAFYCFWRIASSQLQIIEPVNNRGCR